MSTDDDGYEDRWDLAFLERYKGDARFFGNPDGSRADVSEFVDVNELRRSSLYSPSEGRVRVVVGRKGSGKTLYLKKMKADLSLNRSTRFLNGGDVPHVAEAEQTELIGTQHVLRVAHWFGDQILTEIWQQLWNRAILISITTHLLMNPDLKGVLADSDRATLEDDFRSVVGSARWARSPFVTIRSLIQQAKSGYALLSTIDDPAWDDLEARLAYLMQEMPPFYMMIDAIDEEFTHAPMYWMRCQKGLFYETMRLLRHSKLGRRLHIVISIRDLVLYSVFRSEHASRYVGDPSLRVLSWGFEAACAFLNAKLRRLPSWACGPEGGPQTLEDWTGLATVQNRFGDAENLYEYAMRHTQCLPRDVVMLGNALGPVIGESPNGKISEEAFRSVVSDIARLSGLQQVIVAANQLVSDEIPREASSHDFTGSYLSVKEYADDRAARLIDLIASCSGTRIGVQEFQELQVRAGDALDAPDLGTVLWQNGLIGITEPGSADVFFSLDKMGRLRLPVDAGGYVFHPSMREVANLTPVPPAVRWRA